jgi:hypothetical protein
MGTSSPQPAEDGTLEALTKPHIAPALAGVTRLLSWVLRISTIMTEAFADLKGKILNFCGTGHFFSMEASPRSRKQKIEKERE